MLFKHLTSVGFFCKLFDFSEVLSCPQWPNAPDLVVIQSITPDSFLTSSLLVSLRAQSTTLRVIVLSSCDHVKRAYLLDLGADVVLALPYSIEEVFAWIRVQLRQVNHPSHLQSAKLVFSDLSVDRLSRAVTRNGRHIKLTVKEYDLLLYFMSHPGVVLTRQQILQAVWGPTWCGNDNLLDVYIRYLRKKLDFPGSSPLISTQRGVGFVLQEGDGISR